jgi:hypothetical protein
MGFSQQVAIILQICSAVNLSGHPERGRSLSLSITLNSGSLYQRVIHFMTVFFTIPSSDAIALAVSPSSLSKTIRARSTFACDDFRLAIILFSFTFSSSVKISFVHFVVSAYFTEVSLNIAHELPVSRASHFSQFLDFPKAHRMI